MASVIVIPTYNEATSIAPLAGRIHAIVPDAHVLVIDDNSPDGTAAIATNLFRSSDAFSNFTVITRTGPRGLGLAYREGFAMALAQGYDLILQMDADGSHDPQYLPQMIALGGDHDLVVGSRYCPGGALADWPLRRRLLSRFANAYVRRVTGLPIADATAGFRCWSREGLRRVDVGSIRSDGYAFQVEMASRAIQAGLNWVEMPIIFTDRTRGQSKMSWRVVFESIVQPWSLRSRPWRGSRKRTEQPVL